MIERRRYNIAEGLMEDRVWRTDILPLLETLPTNVIGLWEFSFSEMLNNAIDHSGGSVVDVTVSESEENTEILVKDNGIGIFKKIQQSMNLLDERHAVLELSKGKLTTDPTSHSGQGIFFTSRLVDSFHILSGEAAFTRDAATDEHWLFSLEQPTCGTAVFMKLNNHVSRTCEDVCRQYSSLDGFDFTKTVVPVRLALYGEEGLVSRSQAKRVVARVDLFQSVVFDFEGLNSIGRSFADQMFRVFPAAHPQISIRVANATDEIRRQIAGTGFAILDEDEAS